MSPEAADRADFDLSLLAEAAPAVEQATPLLIAYREMLEAWSQRFNLIGPSVLSSFWSRHVLDSAQLLAIAPNALRWVDIGAGAGFPGLVLAILLKDQPGARVHLIESVGKRCRFLEHAAEALALPATVHQARAESLAIAADIVTARACAPLDRLLGYAAPHLALSREGLFLKGRDVRTELTKARAHWRLDADLMPSVSDPEGRIVRVRNLKRG